MSDQKDLTELLIDWSQGNQQALDQLMPLVYQELRYLAGRYLRRERTDHTLQTTALVHEAYLKLIDQKDVDWQNRAHFFAISAQLMRRILIDHARNHHAQKRGGEQYKLPLEAASEVFEKPDLDLLAVDDALNRLAVIDARQSRIVELKFFGGLTIEEIAAVLGVAEITVKRDLRMAKAWLSREIANN